MNLPLFHNTADERSFTLTASVLTLAVVLSKVLLAGVSVRGFTAGPAPDAAVIAALLTPTLGAYVVRRGQEKASP